ncbi:hypothetical protein COCNU_scaffold002650G000010 [Cocos nucifera]|nr:hypothetical protein [Cocos nucifera]
MQFRDLKLRNGETERKIDRLREGGWVDRRPSIREIESGREESSLTAVANEGDRETVMMAPKCHPCPSVGYVQFSIRGAIGVYFIHLDIDCSGTFSTDIYSIDGIYSIDN